LGFELLKISRLGFLIGAASMVVSRALAVGSKIVWLGASTVKATDYGGVTYQQSFAYLTSIFWGYSPADYVNAGIGSNDSAAMLARLQTDVIAIAPKVCVVNVGGIADMNNGVTLAVYRSNLNSIFTQLQAAGIKVAAVNDVMKRYNSLALFRQFRTYTEAYEEVATKLGIPVIDIYREYALSYIDDDYATVWNPRYVDDVHQTVAGNAWIASILSRPRYSGVFN
jgi:lysophospholipase L1-like esterase